MIDLVTSTIVIRNTTYTVREMTGKEMAAVRKLVVDDAQKFRTQNYVASICCVDPKIASELEASALPQLVIERISDEAFRLTKGDDAGEAKNG